MDPLTIGLIGGGVGALGKLFSGKPKVPEYGFGPAEIDKLIESVRSGGLAGLQALGQQQMQGASGRLASMGVASSPAMQAAMFNPIMEGLAGARGQFEGNLAGLQGGFQQHAADMQYQGEMQGEMARWNDMQNLWGGLMDVGGMSLLNMQGGPKKRIGGFGAFGGVGAGASGTLG